MFICQTQKTQNFKKREVREGRRKKYLLSDRSPSFGQINDFSSLLLEELCFFMFSSFHVSVHSTLDYLKTFVVCMFSLLFSNIRSFIEALNVETAKNFEARFKFLTDSPSILRTQFFSHLI